MPPKFSLQTVLDVRHSRVEAFEIEMGELLNLQQQWMDFHVSLQTLQTNLFEQMHDQQKGDLDLFAVNYLHANLNTVQNKLQQTQTVLEELAQKVDAKRVELIAARQAEEVLSILKNKEVERYKAEQTRIENRAQDDIYISQAFRARRAEAYNG